jgi:predicted HicB family RNase H-like nuclease
MERRKTGRPSKGQRHRTTLRLPQTLAEAAQKLAEQRGVTLNDLVGELLAGEVGVAYSDQEVLPISA